MCQIQIFQNHPNNEIIKQWYSYNTKKNIIINEINELESNILYINTYKHASSKPLYNIDETCLLCSLAWWVIPTSIYFVFFVKNTVLVIIHTTFIINVLLVWSIQTKNINHHALCLSAMNNHMCLIKFLLRSNRQLAEN